VVRSTAGIIASPFHSRILSRRYGETEKRILVARNQGRECPGTTRLSVVGFGLFGFWFFRVGLMISGEIPGRKREERRGATSVDLQ